MIIQPLTTGSYSDINLKMTFYTCWNQWLFPFRFTVEGNVKS